MPIDPKSFVGKMNLDDPNDNIGQGWHKDGRNIRFIGDSGNMQVQNALGNVLIPNSSLPAGANQTVGAFYDQVGKRIIFFNYNSNGRNGIYQYSTSTQSLTKIFLCFTDSVTDILNFIRDYPVHSAVLVYRTTSDGDLLYWTDGYNRPRYLNINTVSTTAPFIEDMINAGKDAPLLTLTVAYHNNANINVNNLAKKLFRFAYRYTYANLEKSTLSPISKIPLPVDGFNQTLLADPTKNNMITISGTARLGDNVTVGDITGVEIFGQECEGVAFGDFFLITTIPSTDFSVGTFTYNFLNDSVYTTEATIYNNNNPADGLLYFSFLPDKANTLELLNGNVVIYAGNTDGYPNLLQSDLNVLLYSGLGEGSAGLVIAMMPLTTHQLTGIIGGSGASGTTLTVQFRYSNGTDYNITASILPGLTDLGTITASMVVAINAQLVSAGISGEVTAVQVGIGNTFTITSTNLAGTFSSIVVTNTSLATVTYPNAVLKWNSQYRWGIIYFDDRGKTNGVVSFINTSTPLNNFGYNSLDFETMGALTNQLVPYMMASINHLPPSWAKRFQWVRTSSQTTKNYIHLLTNDYQDPGDGYLYFCIQNLTYLKTQNTGFLPSYQFSAGDRLRVISNYNTANGNRIAYGTLSDYEIVGTVERTMTSPATNGTFIKIKKPSGGFPTYVANNFIEIYTPLLRESSAQQLFYEFGETFELNANQPGSNQLYHSGNMWDQDATTPAGFLFYTGDSYFKPRIFYVNVGDTATKTWNIMSPSYSDYFNSTVTSDGRGWIINPNAGTIYNSVQLRWGGSYQQDTDIDQLNIFNETDFDTIDLSKGDIWKLKVRDRELRVFQDRAVGVTGIYSKYVQDSGGNNLLTTTDSIITPNNIQYYQGEYGLAGYPTSLVSTESVDYFSDPVRGIQVRLSGDGFTPISTLYKGEYTLKGYLTPYGQSILRMDGTRAKIMGWFDYFWGDYVMVLQAGSANGTQYPARTLAFNEPENAYQNFYDIFPDWSICAEATNYHFLNGQLWIQNNDTKYCNYFNQQFFPSITLPFNDKIAIKKTYEALAYQANQYWVAPVNGDITTSQPNPQTNLPQISQLKQVDFDIEEGLYYAAFLRDANSKSDAREALVNGDYLKGVWLECKLTYQGSDFATLFTPYVKYDVSPRNL